MSDYEYSDDESQEELRNLPDEERERILEEQERAERREEMRQRKIANLRRAVAETANRNAKRILDTLDDCAICKEKKFNCVKLNPLTTMVPEGTGSEELKRGLVFEDDSNRDVAVESLERREYRRALDFISKRKCIGLECNHTFHWGCIYMWANTNFRSNPNVKPKCPLCRTTISENVYITFGIPTQASLIQDLPEWEEYDPAAWQQNLLGGRRRRSRR